MALKKDRLISLRVTDDAWDRLEEARRTMGERSVSDVVRFAIDHQLMMLGLEPVGPLREAEERQRHAEGAQR